MEDSDDFFGFGFKGQGLYFMPRGRFSIILRISSGAVEEEPKDKDGSVI